MATQGPASSPVNVGGQVGKATVLLVEDDGLLLDVVALHLERAGYTVLKARTAAEAWGASPDADLVVLDWMLPDESGLTFLRRLRASGRDLPVLMLTARAREVERVEGLEAGADDYLVKPFGMAELVARLKALLRRTRPPERLVVGPLTIDVTGSTVTLGGDEVTLTRREFDLLACLAANPGRVFSRGELLDRVWGDEFGGTERTVDQHVAQLRTRLGAELIETLRGRGYRLVSPST